MEEALIQLGPIGLGALCIYGGTRIEDTDGKNQGKTTASIVLYVVGSILIVGNIAYLINKHK